MSVTNSSCWIFAGPTLNGSVKLSRLPRIKLLPPAKRGDVERLVSTRRPGIMAIVDGRFHQCLSVGHAEIRSALAGGWQVWGLSSMGAIRACEMRHMGMRGYGKVFELFCRDENFRDDEVALSHGPEPPYPALSEPLVHLRLWLHELVTMRLLHSAQERQLVKRLMAMWFGERTLFQARSMVLDLIPKHIHEVDETLRNFDKFRLKTDDLYKFLQEQPWKSCS